MFGKTVIQLHDLGWRVDDITVFISYVMSVSYRDAKNFVEDVLSLHAGC